MNISTHRRFGIAMLAALWVAAPLLAQDEDDDFKPRTGTPPAKRTGGASRGGPTNGEASATVLILAPADTVGLTTRGQPVIYWHLSADTTHPVEIAINDPRKLENPVLEARMDPPVRAGLHKLDLSRLKHDGKAVELEPGVKYDVVVEVVGSEAAASNNASATCRIMRLEDQAVSAEAAGEKDSAKRAALFGGHGVWFDYLDALNAAIAASPKDEALLQKRAKTLAGQRLIWKPDGSIADAGQEDVARKP